MQHLERGLDRQNQFWKYLVTFVSGFFIAAAIGGIPMAVLIFNRTGGNFSSDAVKNPTQYGIPANLSLVLMLLPFVLGLITVIFLIRKLHNRSIAESVNGTSQIRWVRFFKGAGLWGSLMLVSFLISYALQPDAFQLNFKASSFFPLLLIALLLIPLQTTFEEVMYRGYLAQGLASWTRSRLLVLLVPAILFGLSHSGNPEVSEYGFWSTMPMYILSGLVLGLAAVLDDGIELSMGAHAANNILGAVLVSFKSSAFQTPALFYQAEVNPQQELLIQLCISVVFIAILARMQKWDFSVLTRRIEPSGTQSVQGSESMD